MSPFLRTLVPLALSSPALAQNLLLTVDDAGSPLLAEVAGDGTVLATSSGTPPGVSYLSSGRFWHGLDWIATSKDGLEVYDGLTGAHAATIPLPLESYSDQLDVLGGDAIVTEDLFSEKIRVYDPPGTLVAEWPSTGCPAGAQWALEVGPQGEIWNVSGCGYYVDEYDQAGNVLASWTAPVSLLDLDVAPDGTLWGTDFSSMVHHFDPTGAVLGSFPVPSVRAVAVDPDGASLWVTLFSASVVQHYDLGGALLGELVLPAGWQIGSIDVAPELPPIGTSYCGPANLNSTGKSATLAGRGYPQVAANTLVLTAGDLPPGKTGIFVVSKTQAFVPFAGGSQGNLCLGGAIGRYQKSPWVASAGGTAEAQIDLAHIPTPTGTTAAVAGETWNWQAWFRDENPGRTSNFTDGLSVTFL